MNIIIVGAGKVGYSIAERLSFEEHSITLVDTDTDVLEEAQDNLDVLTIEGNGASIDTLRRADADHGDVLIAMMNADEANLLCCLSAKKLGCRYTMARVRDPEYSKHISFLRDDLGLSMAVNPEHMAANEIYRLIQFPSFLKRDSFDKGRVELVEMKLLDGSPLVGKKLYETSSILGLRVLVCAVERDGVVTIPNGGFTLMSGDRVTVTAARVDLASLIKSLGLLRQKIRDVLIIGCGRIAEYLTDELLRSGVNVKVIEKDEKRAEEFQERFPKSLVIKGNASKKGFLESERVDSFDAVISLTGVDEENLVISMYCSHLGIKKTVTKIDRSEYTSLFSDRELGSVVCPKELTANEIIRYIRAISRSGEEGSIRALHRIVDGKAEALEFVIAAQAPYTGVPLAKLKFKSNVLVACITRSSQIIIPNGSDTLQIGDTVIIVTTADRPVYDLKDIFERDAVRD